MIIIELEILIGYLEKIIYFVKRNIKTETNAEIVFIMTELVNFIYPRLERLKKLL
jgi:hypothetical protein